MQAQFVQGFLSPVIPAQSHVTLARVGKLRLSRCAISTRTELIVAPEPLMERHAVGCTPSASRETRSTVPPAWRVDRREADWRGMIASWH